MENWLNYSQWSLFSINLLWNINKFDFSRRRFPLPYPRKDCLNKCQGFLFQLIIDDNVLFKKLENTVSWSSQVLRGGEVGRCVETPPPLPLLSYISCYPIFDRKLPSQKVRHKGPWMCIAYWSQHWAVVSKAELDKLLQYHMQAKHWKSPTVTITPFTRLRLIHIKVVFSFQLIY